MDPTLCASAWLSVEGAMKASRHNEATEETSKAFNTFWSRLLRPRSVHSEVTVVTLNAQLLVHATGGCFPEVDRQGT